MTEPIPHLSELERRIPPVSDKALIDLVNGIQINRELLTYRRNRGFFGQVFDQLSGANAQRQMLLDGNLLAGQSALCEWVQDLAESSRISQVALHITQDSLREVRTAIRTIKTVQVTQTDQLENLLSTVNDLSHYCTTKITAIEQRLHKLEVRVAANEDIEQIFSAWLAGETYTDLPWVIQVAFLARELYSNAILTYELETGDLEKYRKLIVNKILAHCSDLPKQFFSVADLLNWLCQELQDRDIALAAALLEIRSVPQLRLINRPVLFSMGTALELAILPEIAQPKNIGQCAFALCRTNIADAERTTDARGLITAIVHETANDALTVLTQES